MTRLAAAYVGYNHQDLVTAYALASLALPQSHASVVTERKVIDGDCFDDLEVDGRKRTRVQIKSHVTVERPLRITDFTTNNINFRIDDALRSFADDPEPADEYRLFATYDAADEGPGKAISDCAEKTPSLRRAILLRVALFIY